MMNIGIRIGILVGVSLTLTNVRAQLGSNNFDGVDFNGYTSSNSYLSNGEESANSDSSYSGTGNGVIGSSNNGYGEQVPVLQPQQSWREPSFGQPDGPLRGSPPRGLPPRGPPSRDVPSGGLPGHPVKENGENVQNHQQGNNRNQGNNRGNKNNNNRNQNPGKPRGTSRGNSAAHRANDDYVNPILQGAIPEKAPTSIANAPNQNHKNKNKNNGNNNGNHNGHNKKNKNNNNVNRGNGASKNKNKAKGKKRVSQIKFEQYTSSIFPDSVYDSMEEITDFKGRELAQPGEFPHMGAIGYRNTVLNKTVYKCGASLISEYYVITCAHCTEFNGLSPSYVRLGDLNLSAGEEDVDPQTRKIAQILRHPEYNDNSLYNDIALIKLAKPVIFTEFVRPIQIWHHDEIPFTNAFAMGFGAIQFAGASTNRLTVFNLTIVANDVCRSILPKEPNIQLGILDSQICAIDYRKKGSDTYQGDSGGPLQISFRAPGTERLRNSLIGLTSFGVLGANRYPGVYTRVSYYLDWIEQNVWGAEYYAQ